MSISKSNERITCQIRKPGRAQIYYNDKHGLYWDIPANFDLAERRTEKGRILLRALRGKEKDTGVYLCGSPDEGVWGLS